MDLLENADKYGLSKVEEEIDVIDVPLQLIIDNNIYSIYNMPDYIYDINIDLYHHLVNEHKKQNELRIRLYKQMIVDNPSIWFEKYNGKSVDLKGLGKETANFKNIVYNPENNDKFIAIIDTEKQFIHIYEFIADSHDYKAKYIHAKYEVNSNYICHLDYSINQYPKEQYEKIIQNPNVIEKCESHIKIWRLDGKIDIESFYNIIFCMFDKNEKYIKELFSK